MSGPRQPETKPVGPSEKRGSEDLPEPVRRPPKDLPQAFRIFVRVVLQVQLGVEGSHVTPSP